MTDGKENRIFIPFGAGYAYTGYSAIRTGAVPGVSTRYLAHKNAAVGWGFEIFQRAKSMGLGQTLPLWDEPDWT